MSELVLEKDKLKVISVESRVNILKVLSKRRETLSDLSKKLKLSKPTLKEHLDLLEKSGFVRKISSENIWKYYELTEQGKNVLNPSGIKVLFLSISFFVIGLFLLFKYLFTNLFAPTAAVNEDVLYSSAKAVTYSQEVTINYWLLFSIILFAVAIIVLLYYLYKKIKKK